MPHLSGGIAIASSVMVTVTINHAGIFIVASTKNDIVWERIKQFRKPGRKNYLVF